MCSLYVEGLVYTTLSWVKSVIRKRYRSKTYRRVIRVFTRFIPNVGKGFRLNKTLRSSKW